MIFPFIKVFRFQKPPISRPHCYFLFIFFRLKSSDSDPAVITKHQEQLEFEKKRFEDFEFQLMEGEAHTETEKEDILNEIRYLENEIQGTKNRFS